MASTPAANTTEDLTDTVWRDDEWLRFYPLTVATVLDYFALSTFYDTDCLNEMARRQGLDPTQAQCVAARLTDLTPTLNSHQAMPS